jgi:hypothetical protein
MQRKNTCFPLVSDSLSISGYGVTLAGKLHSNEPSSDTEVNLMERTISEVGKILKKMKTLSTAAEDESISDEERIDMQIQMTKLQSQLYKKTYGMSVEIASKGGNRNFNTNLLNAIDYDESMTIKLLERERARITNGGAFESGDQLLLEQRVPIRIENDPESQGLKEAYLDKKTGNLAISDEWSMKSIEEGTVQITGQRAIDLIGSDKVISDEDRLARNNLSLMNSKSAKASTKKIQNQIVSLENISYEIKELKNKNSLLSVDTSLMRSQQNGFGENPLSAHDLDSADIRLTVASDEKGKMYQKLDAFLKDRLHKNLGLGDLWDDIQNITYA